MGTVALGVQVLLAVVFATAAVGKFLDLRGSRRALVDFGVPKGPAQVLGVLLPIGELIAAVALVPEPTARWGALLALLLLLAFIGGIASALARGKAPDCHCFGQISSKPAGPATLIRNGVLAALALVVVVHGAGTPIDDWVSARTAAELAAVGLGIATAALAGLCATLWDQRRKLRDAVETQQAELDTLPPGLPVGLKAPNFALPDLDDRIHTLPTLVEGDVPVMLIFAGPRCGACKTMMPDVARWQDALEGRLNIAVMTGGSREENLAPAEEHGVQNMILQEDYEVMWEYRVRATPTAVVVGPDLKVASLPALGAGAIEALIRLALAREDTITPGRSSLSGAQLEG